MTIQWKCFLFLFWKQDSKKARDSKAFVLIYIIRVCNNYITVAHPPSLGNIPHKASGNLCPGMCINKLKRFQMCRYRAIHVEGFHQRHFMLMWWCFCTKSYIIIHHLLLQHKPLMIKKYCTYTAENVTNSLHKHHQPVTTTTNIDFL